MEDKTIEAVVHEALQSLTVTLEPDLLEKFDVKAPAQDIKSTKKRFKKHQVEEGEPTQRALEKFNKVLDEVAKSYENSGKQFLKMRLVKAKVDAGETEREKANKQKVMFENLFNSFKKKYDNEIKIAEEVEKEEEAKRKQVIEELQERIKTIQSKYEEAGKIKIQKFRENQTLKHQLSKYEPHLVASQSLAEAQLKKKTIQVQIQMTTLKQKIQMMASFKTMREETQEKLKKSKEIDEKVSKQVKKLASKEEDHKISLARAHLTFEDYKKAFNVLKVVLPQKEKDAFLSKEKVKKAQASLDELIKKIEGIDKDYQTHQDQLDVLKKLELQLQKQLEE